MVYEISVVICAYTERRWDNLVTAVESAKKQTLPPKEILVVIDRNPALLARVTEQLSGIIAIENTQAKGASGSRNTGAKVAQGTILAFLDDDAIAQADWIHNLLAAYSAPDIVGVGGKIDPLWGGICPFWFPAEFNWVVGCSYKGMPTKNTSVRNVIGANMSVRRDVLLSVGGFRESFGNTKGLTSAHPTAKWFRHQAGGEETELCIRVTRYYPASVWLYTTSAVVQHHVPTQRARLAYFLWRCYDEGLGKARLVSLYNRQTGLAAERDYTLKILPGGVAQGLLTTLLRFEVNGAFRAGAIVLGFTVTTIGYLVGSIVSRTPRDQQVDLLSLNPHCAIEAPPPVNVQ